MSFKRTAVIVAVTSVLVLYVPSLIKPRPLRPDVEGWTAPGWKRVTEAFRTMLKGSTHSGGAFSVYYRGEKVVDLYGGYSDQEFQSLWKEDTIFQFFSSTKGVCAIIVAMLVDRGHIDYDEKVSLYWPEFAQNGKEDVTVKQLLSHQVGLIELVPKPDFKTVQNTEVLGNLLAAQKPAWKPGTANGYHALTFGLYVDALVRRTDPKKRGIKQFFAEELAQPFDIDFYVGLPLEKQYRRARHYDPLFWDWLYRLFTQKKAMSLNYNLIFKESPTSKAFTTIQLGKEPAIWQDPHFHTFPFGSLNGFGTARALAKLYGIIAGGGKHNGKTLLSERMVKKITEIQCGDRDDVVLTFPINWGYGFMVEPLAGNGVEIGHPGYGGQIGLANPEKKYSIAYLSNYMSSTLGNDDARYRSLYDSAMACIQEQEAK